VTDITDSGVTLDANHPLAGKDLVFDIFLTEIL
jgi:peptidylprolyl isomerase